MKNKFFFDKPTEQSLAKSRIVSKYFSAWSKIMMKQAKKRGTNMAYVDLFCGPGGYKDGSPSTPLIILKQAIANPEMQQKLITLFNDVDAESVQNLKEALNDLPNLEKLNHRPRILNIEVGATIIQELQRIQSGPTLFFIDPWGYKGLSLKLIGSVIQNWGCDCLFFFNYNRINMGLNNPVVEEHINSLFGTERANALKQETKKMLPNERESTIMKAIFDSLKEVGGSYAQEFSFKKTNSSRTSHYLIFVSKHSRGLSIIKDIMAKESSGFDQGVPSYEYSPDPIQLSLFSLLAIDDLENSLLDEFAGQTLTMVEIYEQHHVGKRYIKANYKEALKKLEQDGKILVDRPANKRSSNKGKITFGDKVKVSFPPHQSR